MEWCVAWRTLAYAISVISRFMANLGKAHWETLKWTLRYLKESTNIGLMFQKQENISQAVVGYVNTYYAGNLDTRKSVTGFVSTVESYIAVSGCTLNNRGKLHSRHRGDKRVGLVEGTDN